MLNILPENKQKVWNQNAKTLYDYNKDNNLTRFAFSILFANYKREEV